jgi:hypothetical protein
MTKRSLKKTLQTPNVSIALIKNAEKRAVSDGLGSIHDAVRLFLNQYAEGEIMINVISKERIPTINEIDAEVDNYEKQIKKGDYSGLQVAKTLDEHFRQLDN